MYSKRRFTPLNVANGLAYCLFVKPNKQSSGNSGYGVFDVMSAGNS
jgi:hypothetical protein